MFLLPLSPVCAHRTMQMGIKPSSSIGQTLASFCWVSGHGDGKEPSHRANTKTSYTADPMGTGACCFSADRNSLSINRIWEKWEAVFLTHTVNSIRFPSPSVHRPSSSRHGISVNLKHQPRGLQHSCCREIHEAVNGKNYKKPPQLKGFMECHFSRWQMDALIDLSTFLRVSQHFSKSAKWVWRGNSHLTLFYQEIDILLPPVQALIMFWYS